MTVFETLLAMDRAHAVNAVLTTTFVALFVLGNFVLFVIVRPVTTLITTVVLLGIFIMGFDAAGSSWYPLCAELTALSPHPQRCHPRLPTQNLRAPPHCVQGPGANQGLWQRQWQRSRD